MIERPQQQAYEGRVDAFQGCLHERLAPEPFPEWQHADDEQERGQKDRENAERGSEPSIGRWSHHSAEIGSKREQYPGQPKLGLGPLAI
jgi:hypothetical protein